MTLGIKPPGNPLFQLSSPIKGTGMGNIWWGLGGQTTLGPCLGSQHIHWFSLGVTYLTKARQVTQMGSSSLYIHLALFSGSVCRFLSMQPNHIFLYQMYRNSMDYFSLDQFTHILPSSIWHNTMPRYYFLGTTFTNNIPKARAPLF